MLELCIQIHFRIILEYLSLSTDKREGEREGRWVDRYP